MSIIKGLAYALVFMFLFSQTALALTGDITLSGVRTENGENAAAVALKLLPEIPQDKIFAGDRWALYLQPNVDLKSGSEDALDSFIFKAQGFGWVGIKPGLKCNWVHILPYSVGMETTSEFSEIAAIAEVGYTPLGPCQEESDRFGLSEYRRAGVFLQGGYLFDANDEGTTSSEGGGDAKKSKEDPNDPVARLKLDLHYGWKMGRLHILPSATLWYDMINSKIYYHLEADTRIFITETGYFNLKYEKGSGAPNFNTGDQFGAGLGIVF